MAQRRPPPAAVNGHSCLRWLSDISGTVAASVTPGGLPGTKSTAASASISPLPVLMPRLDTVRCFAAGS